MKKKIFDVSLYRDGLRQLRTLGLLFALIMVLETVLLPVGMMVNMADSTSAAPYTMSLWNMHPCVLLTYCLIAPILTLQMFRFTTSRPACDFYHSIPQTRTCLYTSFLGAIFTWTFAIQWGTTALSMLIHRILSKYFTFDAAEILKTNLIISTGAVLVVGAVALAVTLTGTAFTNFVVSLLILFAPRLLMYVLRVGVGSNLKVVSEDHYLTFLGNTWNVVTGSVYGVFCDTLLNGDLEVFQTLFDSWSAGAYTLALGLIYLALAGALFRRRKSETAGLPAIHPMVQLTLRLIPASVFCLIPDYEIFDMMASRVSFDMEMLYLLFVLYLVGFLLYFLYELLSSRKISGLKKAAPGALLLVAIHAAVIFGMYGLERSVLSYSPDASEIDAVSLTYENQTVWIDQGDDGMYEYKSYLTSRASKIRLDSQEIRELAAEGLAEAVAYNSDLNGYKMSEDSVWTSAAIYQGEKIVYRNLLLSEANSRTLAAALKSQPEFKEIYMNLPDSSDEGLTLSNTEISDPEKLKTVYEALKQDIADMGFEDWYIYCTYGADSEYLEYTDGMTSYTTEATLSMCYREYGLTTAAAFDLSSKTPLALAAYQQAVWESEADQRKSLLSDLRELDTGLTAGTMTVNASDAVIYLSTLEGDTDYTVDLSFADDRALLIRLIEAQEDAQADDALKQYTLPYRLSLSFYGENESGEEISFYYNISVVTPAGFDLTEFAGNSSGDEEAAG